MYNRTGLTPLIALIFMINWHLVASNLFGSGGGGGGSSSSIFSEIKSVANKYRFSATPTSYVNEYLCQKLKRDQSNLDKNIEQLRRVAYALKHHQTSERIKEKLRSKVDILMKVIDMHKSGPGSLCEVSGQDMMQLVDLEVKLLLDDQQKMPDKARGCLPIKAIVDHLNAERRAICSNYMTELLLDKVNRMDAEPLRRVTGSMDAFMDLIMVPLGGFNTSTCSLPLDRLQFTNREAGEALVKGLRLVVVDDDDWLNSVGKKNIEDERQFLQKFAQMRNDYLVKPCEYFTDQLKNRITTVKLYKSLYSSYESEPQFESSKSSTNTKRFHRAWALYNTCQLLLQKLPTISISLLEGLGFHLADSKLDNRQIYELIR